MKIKTIVQSSFFLALTGCAAIYFFNGKQGLRTYLTLKKEFRQEQATVEKLEHNIKEISQDIQTWQTDQLERERVARQDYGMSFTNELVYVTPTK